MILRTILMCLTLLSLGFAQTDIFMKIKPTNFQPVRVIVAPFTSETHPEIAQRVRQILIDDLNYSGYVTVVAKPDTARGFLVESADMLAEAQLSLESGKLLCNFTLKELLTNWTLINKKFNHPSGAERALAHTIADEVVYRLTGESGIARTKIAFVRVIDKYKELALMDYDGANQQVLTSLKSIGLSPDWSPDGKQLIFSSLIPAQHLASQLVIFNFASNQISRLTQIVGPATSPVFSPDGKKIAFSLTTNGNTDIYVSDTHGNNLRRLTQNPGIDTSPAWSPNGKSLAFTSDRSGSPQIYLMDADGANIRRLTYNNDYNASPAWSPRGDVIAYESQESNGFQIYLITPDGEEVQCITDRTASYADPVWAPNGLHLACASNRTGKWEIYSMYLDGSRLKRLTFSGNNTQPAWSPSFNR